MKARSSIAANPKEWKGHMTSNSKKTVKRLNIVGLVFVATGLVVSYTSHKLAGSVIVFTGILFVFARAVIEFWGLISLDRKETEAGTGSDKSAN
jgi:hypothetical protein